MPYNENKRKYNIEYEKKNLKRVPLVMQISHYERLKSAASAAGESINGYIKNAIDQRIRTETKKD